jgi:hypothetical protein
MKFTVPRRKLVIALLFGAMSAPLYSVAQTLMTTPGGYTSDGRRLADLNLVDLQSEISGKFGTDNRVLKNLLWSVQRNGTGADLVRFDSFYLSFKAASENGMSRIHSSVRGDYTPEVLEQLWIETREVLKTRGVLSCGKVF